MSTASRDPNNVPTLLAVSTADFSTPVTLYADPVSHRLLVNIVASQNIGQTTLVSGTKAITIASITASSHAFVQLVSPVGTNLTVQYQAVCTTNTLTIQANVAAGTINIADGSTVNYFIV